MNRVFLGAGIGLAALAATLLYTHEVKAHTAPATAALPLGWDYPQGCCHNRDCAVLDPKYVTEGPDGYEVNMPAGSHPMLKTKGYSGTVPYSVARDSPDGEYHICLAMEGTSRFCFFAGARGS